MHGDAGPAPLPSVLGRRPVPHAVSERPVLSPPRQAPFGKGAIRMRPRSTTTGHCPITSWENDAKETGKYAERKPGEERGPGEARRRAAEGRHREAGDGRPRPAGRRVLGASATP